MMDYRFVDTLAYDALTMDGDERMLAGAVRVNGGVVSHD